MYMKFIAKWKISFFFISFLFACFGFAVSELVICSQSTYWTAPCFLAGWHTLFLNLSPTEQGVYCRATQHSDGMDSSCETARALAGDEDTAHILKKSCLFGEERGFYKTVSLHTAFCCALHQPWGQEQPFLLSQKSKSVPQVPLSSIDFAKTAQGDKGDACSIHGTAKNAEHTFMFSFKPILGKQPSILLLLSVLSLSNLWSLLHCRKIQAAINLQIWFRN